MFELDPRLTRASRRELHQKSAAAATTRRATLGAARAALVAGKAAGHAHTGSARFTSVHYENGAFDYRFPSGSFGAGPWARAYTALARATAAQLGLGQCHRLWGLLDAFARGKPYRRCERHTKTPTYLLRNQLVHLALEALADAQLRKTRGEGVMRLNEGQVMAVGVLEAQLTAWLDAPA